jgi:hypothetical protein
MEILYLTGKYSLMGDKNEISLYIDGAETPISLKRGLIYTKSIKDKHQIYYYNKLMETVYNECDPFDFMDAKYYSSILPNMLKWYREYIVDTKLKQLLND